MANREHVEIVKDGARAIHEWNAAHPDVGMDLAGADLCDVKLGSTGFALAGFWVPDLSTVANLSGAAMADAKLVRANLCGADLSKADLRRTDLTDANLRGAKLRRADLSWARLKRATLELADLGDTLLHSCDLSEANFSQSYLGNTALAFVQLDQAQGLENVRHMRASAISTQTLRLSEGRVPSAFLLGCGFSEWEIEAAELYDPNLGPNEIAEIQQRVFELRSDPFLQFYSAFVSYSQADKTIAHRVHAALQERRIPCWLDEHRLTVGEEILPAVIDAIRQHDFLILCCSESSLASDWVEAEIEEALEKEKRLGRKIILPIDLDGYLRSGWKGPLAVQIRKRLAADFRGWEDDEAKFTASLERVIAALRLDEGGREPVPESQL